MFRPLKIATYLKGMAKLGISAEAVLEKSGIEAEKIQLLDYLISHEQYSMVVRNMIRLTKNPGVSFYVGKLSDINDYGIIGYAMMSSNTLGDATDVWIKFSNSMIGEPIKTSWQTLGLGHELTFIPPPYSGDLYVFEIEELLAQGIKIITSLTGVRPIFDRVSFAYPAPSHLDLYKETFNCLLEFDAPRTSARILTPNFDHPITTKKPRTVCSLLAVLQRHTGVHTENRPSDRSATKHFSQNAKQLTFPTRSSRPTVHVRQYLTSAPREVWHFIPRIERSVPIRIGKKIFEFWKYAGKTSVLPAGIFLPQQFFSRIQDLV